MSELIKKIEHALNASESNLMTDVLNDCLEALNDEWISIDDRLPDNKSGVIAANADQVSEVYFDFYRFNHAYDIEIDEHDIKFIQSITHWKPLPQPPK